MRSRPLSARAASWLFIHRPEKLKVHLRPLRLALVAVHSEVREVVILVSRLARMIRGGRANRFGRGWSRQPGRTRPG